MLHYHDGVPCHYPLWEPPPRCTGNGHRPVIPGLDPPVQTRERPVRFWLFELISRAEARLYRKHAG